MCHILFHLSCKQTLLSGFEQKYVLFLIICLRYNYSYQNQPFCPECMDIRSSSTLNVLESASCLSLPTVPEMTAGQDHNLQF